MSTPLGYQEFLVALLQDESINDALFSSRQQADLSSACDELIAGLNNSRRADIVRRVFGLRMEKKDVRFIANSYRISQAAVRDAQKKALNSMRDPHRSRKLRELLGRMGFVKHEAPVKKFVQFDRLKKIVQKGGKVPVSDLRSVSIVVLEVTPRVRNSLLKGNIKNLNDLRRTSKKKLLLLPNFSQKCLDEVERAAAQVGIVLPG